MKKSNCDPVKPPYSVLNDLPLEKQHPALGMKARQGSLFTEIPSGLPLQKTLDLEQVYL